MLRRTRDLFVVVGLLVLGGAGRLSAQVIPPGTYITAIPGDTINSSVVYVDPGATFTSPTLTLTSSAGVYWRQVGTLSGKTISQAGGGYIYVSGANNALTLAADTSVTGGVTIYSDGSSGTAITNLGTITNNAGSGSIYALNFANSGSITGTGGTYLYLGSTSVGYNSTNTGTITANGANTYVYLRGNFDNNGTVTAQNSGILIWDGLNTSANLGNVTIASGGRALLNGTIDNTASTLIAPTGGTFELYGGTIKNGTIASGALTFTTSGGYLDGATLTGNLTLATSSSYVRMINGASYTGTSVTLANNTGVYWQQAQTIASQSLTFGNGSYFYVQGAGNSLTLNSDTLTMGSGAYIYLSGANTSLTLDAGTTATGSVSFYSDGNAGTTITNNGTITHNLGSGSLYAVNFTNAGSITGTSGSYLYLNYPSVGYNFTNTGTVTADGTGTYVYLRGNFDNNGTVTAQNSGNLLFDGANTTANLGNVVISTGGRALLNGTIDNTAATLTAPTGGTFELYGGTIKNGTIASGALTFTTSGGYLDGATFTGNLNLVNASTYVRMINGASYTGTSVTLANNTGVYWQQAQTIASQSLTFGNGGYFYVQGAGNSLTLNSDTLTMGNGAYIYLSGANTSLTLDANTTATGSVSFYSDGSAGTTITNNGTITHNLGSGSFYAVNFTNAGSITGTSGSYLYLNYPSVGYNFTNTGTVTADGAGTNVYLRGNFDNNGTVTAQNSGNLVFDGTNTTANLGNVVISTGGRALLNGTIDNTAATLTAPTGGTFELYGGTIKNGTIAAGALTFTSSGGYLDGATFTGNLTLANTSTYVRMLNGASYTGTSVSLANYAGVYWQQAQTIASQSLTFGTGGYFYVQGAGNSLTLNSDTLTMGNGAYIYLSGANTSLTLDANTTATGSVSFYSDGSAGTTITNNGTITHNLGSGSFYAVNFTNAGSITGTSGSYLYLNYPSVGYNFTNTGTVTADGAGTNVYLRGNFDNNGTVTAQNSGNLVFDGTNTTANLGNVVISTGGRALLNGTIDNTAATLTAPTGGTFELYGGTIKNGTIASGALTFTTSGGYLDGATFTGNLNLVNASTYVRMINGASITGTTITMANSAGIYWQQVGSLIGKSITMGSGAYLYLTGTGSSLTLDATTTVSGNASIYSDGSSGTSITNQATITHNVGSGSLYASTFTNTGSITGTNSTYLYLNYPSAGYNFTNTGTVTADGSGTYVYLRGNFDNNGTLTAQNSGNLYWDGTNTTANLGSVVLTTGGRALLNGTIDNTAATFTAPTGGSFELYGGTIKNGTIASGALNFTTSGGYLDASTFTGDISLPASSYVRLINGASFSGTNLTFANNSGFYWSQVGTLTGKIITQGTGSYLYVTGAGNTLTLDPTTTATGTISIYTDTSAGTAITNQGTLTHNSSTGYLYANTLVNQGSVTINGGTFYLGYYSSHTTSNSATGSVTVNGGSTVYVNTPLANAGQILIQNGTMYTYNNLFTNVGTGLLGGAGTINGDLTLSGGTLAPGNAGIGTLTITSSDFVVTAPTVFAMDVNGTTSDRITFQTPTSAVNLGAGLVTLSINLLAAPTAGTTYTLSNIATGGFGYTGYFANVPNSGDALIANFAGTDYTLNVFYLGNTITMQVPEPSTYALLASGLAAFALRWRRRRA